MAPSIPFALIASQPSAPRPVTPIWNAARLSTAATRRGCNTSKRSAAGRQESLPAEKHETPPQPRISASQNACHSDRSEAERRNLQLLHVRCHSDRGEAERRNPLLLLVRCHSDRSRGPAFAFRQITPMRCHSDRSGGTCSCFLCAVIPTAVEEPAVCLPPYRPQTLSFRPKRSVAEEPAVASCALSFRPKRSGAEEPAVAFHEPPGAPILEHRSGMLGPASQAAGGGGHPTNEDP